MTRENDEHRYDDIITLPHHESVWHPKLSKESYAAQFSPFAALTGYDGVIRETERLTDEMPERTESEAEELDRKIEALKRIVKTRPAVILTVFRPDETKEGGRTEQIAGNVRRVDTVQQCIMLTDGREIALSGILAISGEEIEKASGGIGNEI